MKILNKEIILGSAQFDLKYGIKHFGDQIDLKEIIEIFKLSKGFINSLDTSANYKNVEKLISTLNLQNFNFYTKTLSLNTYNIDIVKTRLEKSLNYFGENKIEGLYIHNFNDINNKNFDLLYQYIVNLKKNKIINKIGFSIYDKKQIQFLIKNYSFDIIQVPINIFDQRLIINHLKILKQKKITIIARSIFLQGLLLNLNNYPNYFKKWSKKFTKFDYFLKTNKIEPVDACLSFVNNIEEIDKIIIGIKNSKQLDQILNFKLIKNLNFDEFSMTDKNLIDPRKWNL